MSHQIEKGTLYYSDESGVLVARDSSKSVAKRSSEEKREPKRIVLFGAAGGTGLQFIEQGVLAGHKITAAVRNPAALEKYKDQIEIKKVDLFNREDIEEVV